jgi:hypothetical protein
MGEASGVVPTDRVVLASDRAVVYPELVLVEETGRLSSGWSNGADIFGRGDGSRAGLVTFEGDMGPDRDLFHCSASPTLMLLLLLALEFD